MATKKQVDELMRLFAESRTAQMNSVNNRTQVMSSESAVTHGGNQANSVQSYGWQRQWSSGNDGMLGVLILLYRTDDTVTAGKISEVMHITTGRVTALIKKMTDKGLVTHEKSAEDARVTVIGITEKGRHIVQDIEKKRNDQMKKLIDTVGMDRLREYIRTSQEVFSILTPISVDL